MEPYEPADSVDAQWAAQELLRRQRARKSLIEFSQSIDIPGIPSLDQDPLDEVDEYGRLVNRFETQPIHFAPVESRIALHHVVLMNAIQRCIDKDRGRLMVFMPPGAAKSTYCSVVAPAYCMGRAPRQQIIMASYASTIAAKQSRKVREIARSSKYTNLWLDKPRLLDDQRAVDDWSLTNGSSMMSAGLLAGITGNRADGLIIDDPIANREQADSTTIREKIYAEFIDTAMTRGKPKMWCIIVQTRWSEEDLAGMILPADYEGESGFIKCRDGQTWDVLCIPAKAERDDDPLGREKGEYLWPEWWPRDHWRTWEDNPRAARTWAALYQQRPAPFSGIHFNLEMFKRFNNQIAPSDESVFL